MGRALSIVLFVMAIRSLRSHACDRPRLVDCRDSASPPRGLHCLGRGDYDTFDMREYRYVVDRDGRVFHDGSEVTDPLVLRFFLRAMQQTPDGRYLVLCQGERNWFEAQDTPFVVQRLRPRTERGHLVSAELGFAGDYHEPLDPDGLEAEEGYLYCRVRGGLFRARFGRAAIQHLGPFLVEEDGGPALLFGGGRYPIRRLEAAERPGAGTGSA